MENKPGEDIMSEAIRQLDRLSQELQIDEIELAQMASGEINAPVQAALKAGKSLKAILLSEGNTAPEETKNSL
jgi:hypothetical protein